jgi:hypothetical protein
MHSSVVYMYCLCSAAVCLLAEGTSVSSADADDIDIEYDNETDADRDAALLTAQAAFLRTSRASKGEIYCFIKRGRRRLAIGRCAGWVHTRCFIPLAACIKTLSASELAGTGVEVVVDDEQQQEQGDEEEEDDQTPAQADTRVRQSAHTHSLHVSRHHATFECFRSSFASMCSLGAVLLCVQWRKHQPRRLPLPPPLQLQPPLPPPPLLLLLLLIPSHPILINRSLLLCSPSTALSLPSPLLPLSLPSRRGMSTVTPSAPPTLALSTSPPAW